MSDVDRCAHATRVERLALQIDLVIEDSPPDSFIRSRSFTSITTDPILASAILFPSSHVLRPWSTRTGTRRTLREASGMSPHPLTAQVDIQNFVLITHAVPAERVRVLIPGTASLQTFRDESESELALVSAGCFCNRDLQPTYAPWPRHTFNQVTFRAFIEGDDRPAAYFLGTYVSTALSFAGQRALTTPAHKADFTISIDSDETGYDRYDASVMAGDEVFSFSVSAHDLPMPKHPFTAPDEMVAFITHRLNGYSKNPVGDLYSFGPVDHALMQPWSGTLQSFRCDFWERLGILGEGGQRLEASDPYSVLVQPSVRFTLHPPRPVRTVPRR